MAEKKSISVEPYSETELVSAPAAPEVYANHAQLSLTLWDIAMHFGTVVGLNREHSKLQVHRKVSVVLSPEQAKALQMALANVIEKYESRFGKVRFPVDEETPHMISTTENLATGETSEVIEVLEP